MTGKLIYPPARIQIGILIALITIAVVGASEHSQRLREGVAKVSRHTPLLQEGFEGNSFPPPGWKRYFLAFGNEMWIRVTSLHHSGYASARHSPSIYPSSGQNSWVVSPAINVPSSGANLTFWERTDSPSSYEKHSLLICQNFYIAPVMGDPLPCWTEIASFGEPPYPVVWRKQFVSLDAFAGKTVWLAWRYQGYSADWWAIDDILVQLNLPELTYLSHELLVDACDSGDDGDSNGYLEPGEECAFSVTLQNSGHDLATGISAVLSTNTPGVTINAGSTTFPEIPVGSIGTSLFPFEIELDQGFTCGYPINFILTLTSSSDRDPWTTVFSHRVGALGTVVAETENFDEVSSPALPDGWTQRNGPDDAIFAYTTTASTHPTGIVPHSPPNMLYWDIWDDYGAFDNLLYYVTPKDLSTFRSFEATFWMYHDTQEFNYDWLRMNYSTNGGSNWFAIGPIFCRYNGTNGWTEHIVDLTSLVGNPSVMIGIYCHTAYGNNIYIDDVTLSGVPYVCTICFPPCAIDGCTLLAEPSSGAAPLTVNLSGSANISNCSETLEFTWAFNDGSIYAGQNVSHTFIQGGVHHVTMYVAVGDQNCVATKSIPVCELACFGGPNVSSGLVPLSVDFTSNISVNECSEPLFYHWDFGNGQCSTEAHPTIIYSEGGTYDWSLTTTSGEEVCILTGTIQADPFDLHFLDDQNRSRLCINSRSGAFEWQVLSGTGYGKYTGVCQIAPKGDLIDYTTEQGLPYELKFRYQPGTGHADGVFTYRQLDLTSRLDDRNVHNNPPGCD